MTQNDLLTQFHNLLGMKYKYMSQLERKSHSGTNIFGNLPGKAMLIKYHFHYLFVLTTNPTNSSHKMKH